MFKLVLRSPLAFAMVLPFLPSFVNHNFDHASMCLFKNLYLNNETVCFATVFNSPCLRPIIKTDKQCIKCSTLFV